MNRNMSENKELPAVHLSVDELEKVEDLLRENTTKCEIEIVLSLPGGSRPDIPFCGTNQY
jgi:hypothetical protein